MNMEEAYQTFISESHELLQDMEDKLVEFDASESKSDDIDAIFRAAHTIKGSSGLFGLDDVVAFTHVVESVLDHVRSGSLPLDEKMIGLLLICKDHMGLQIDSIEDGKLTLAAADLEKEKELLAQLSEYLEPQPLETDVSHVPQAVESVVEVVCQDAMQNDNWHLSIHFGCDVLRNGMDPLSFIHYLEKIGSIDNIITLHDSIPDTDHMDPESCYLAFEINFKCDEDKSTIENVFEFVREDCILHIIPPRAKSADFIKVIEELSNEDLKLGEILVRCGTLTECELEHLLGLQEKQRLASETGPKLGEVAVDQELAAPEVVEAALNKQVQIKKSKKNQTVRVDSEKLDNLINLIGELVIAGASVESEIRLSAIPSLIESALPMIRLVEEVRDSALNLRMVQIGDTFNRFRRIVRDVSQDLGKNIELEISGGDTELDKTVIEKIGDPLTHLVRNSIDHGIESPEKRLENGKPEVGFLRLNAFHESGSIVIEVSDDGGGLDCDRILAKAQENGLIQDKVELSEQDIFQLIFEPGFSTASQVSNISGRGVGMDVVRKNIEALRGSIEIDSVLKQGTTMRIRLPLTLAIIDGFLVKVGGSSYVIPLDLVVECIELKQHVASQTEDQNYINLRGEVLPFVRLSELFGNSSTVNNRESIVVVQYGSVRAGLVVDELLGEFQTVIKPLSKIFESLIGIGGSTILGSGEVALILDIPSLVQRIEKQESRYINQLNKISKKANSDI
ncbi:MAG: chemotaxis protein CheA [Pseudomonadales bacterium]|nr:chemotaxis protein CheA [Pseudomonadales bacterium]